MNESVPVRHSLAGQAVRIAQFFDRSQQILYIPASPQKTTRAKSINDH